MGYVTANRDLNACLKGIPYPLFWIKPCISDKAAANIAGIKMYAPMPAMKDENMQD